MHATTAIAINSIKYDINKAKLLHSLNNVLHLVWTGETLIFDSRGGKVIVSRQGE